MRTTFRIYKFFTKSLSHIVLKQEDHYCELMPRHLCNTTAICMFEKGQGIDEKTLHHCTMFGPRNGYLTKLKSNLLDLERYFEKLLDFLPDVATTNVSIDDLVLIESMKGVHLRCGYTLATLNNLFDSVKYLQNRSWERLGEEK